MEPVGLTVGVVGLAGLFSSCLECFELIQRGRYFGADFLLLETKYTNQRLRLWTWGRACGLVEGDDPGDHGCPTWNHEVVSAVEETLGHIASLFQNHNKFSQRYGLRAVDAIPTGKALSPSALLRGLVPRLRATNLARLTQPQPTSEADKSPWFPATARWAIEGKSRFSDLVQHLKDFIDDLESLTARSDMDVRKRQRRYIQDEFESIIEPADLGMIERARMVGRDAVADAASTRLYRIQENAQSESAQGRVHEEDGVDVRQPPLTASEDSVAKYRQKFHRFTCDLCPTRVFLDEPSYALSSAVNMTISGWFSGTMALCRYRNPFIFLGNSRSTISSRSWMSTLRFGGLR